MHVYNYILFREAWSKEYFKKLRAAHQNHYEQFGELTGKSNILSYFYERKAKIICNVHTIKALKY